MTREDKLRAFTYAMYIMADSYFDKTNCLTKGLKEKCFLQQQELNPMKQVDNEKRALTFLKKEVLKSFPKALYHEPVEIRLLTTDPSHWEVRLYNDNFIIRIFLYMEDGSNLIQMQKEILYNRPNLEKHYQIERKVVA